MCVAKCYCQHTCFNINVRDVLCQGKVVLIRFLYYRIVERFVGKVLSICRSTNLMKTKETRAILWKVLYIGMAQLEKLPNGVKAMYVVRCVQVNSHPSAWFSINADVRQGCVMLTSLFILMQEAEISLV